MKNVLGRDVPYRPFEGAREHRNLKNFMPPSPKKKTVFKSLEEVLDSLELHDGMTISFHHHLRNGDFVLNMVMEELHDRGIKNITLAASSLFPCHEPLVKMLKDGTVTKIHTGYISGAVAKAVSDGLCKEVVTIGTHGGRPRAILEGDIEIDVAFVAASAVDSNGNITGSEGKNSCGVLGYAYPDCVMAKKVVVITDTKKEKLIDIEISGEYVDYVVEVEEIGNPEGIVSGTTQITKDPVGLKIARDTAEIIKHSGLFKDGFSFQSGAGGISLACASELRELMRKDNVHGSFASGGITGYITDMLDEGLFDELWDVQCFDLKAAKSLTKNPKHKKMTSYDYADPNNPEAIASKLDFVILGCSEIDLDYNVNVTTGSDGVILGGSGGHADTACGAKLSIIVSKLVNARVSSVVDKVGTVSTPGETVDVIVTDRGIAVNPKNSELIEKLRETKLDIVTIEELFERALELTGVPKKKENRGRIVAVSEYRDGTLLDVIRLAEK